MTRQSLRLSLVGAVVWVWACGVRPPAEPTSLGSELSVSPIGQSTTAAAGGKQAVYAVDAVNHGGPYSHPTWISTASGSTSKTTFFVRWPAAAVNVTPTGSSYALTDEGQMTVHQQAGPIVGITLYIQDVAGPNGVQHATDEIAVAPVNPSSGGFVLHVHADSVPVYRLKGHTGGPRVGMIGRISVGDLVYLPNP